MTMIARYLVVFLPVALIALQSYFKIGFIGYSAALTPSWPEALYWLARACMFAWFVLAIYCAAPSNVSTPSRPIDAYQTERAARDPLLGLRALACLNVIMGHWFMVVFGPVVPPISTTDNILRYLLSFSPWCGVWMFFTLSGYLMGKGFVTGRHATSRKGLIRFFHNRVLRIFPIYFTAVLVVGILVSPGLFDLRSREAWNALLALFLFDLHDGGPIGALWSVSTEFQFYLLAPVFYLLLAKVAGNQLALLAVAVLLLLGLSGLKMHTLQMHPELWHDKIYYPLLANLDCFLVGMITSFLADLSIRQKRYIKRGLGLGFALAAGFQVLASAWSFPEMASYPGFPGSATRFNYLAYGPGATALATAILIYVFELAERKSKAGWSLLWKLSSMGGLMTYCLYVFHEPVLLSVRRIFPGEMTIFSAVKIFPFGIVLTIAVAYVFYQFVEKHFDKKRYQAPPSDSMQAAAPLNQIEPLKQATD